MASIFFTFLIFLSINAFAVKQCADILSNTIQSRIVADNLVSSLIPDDLKTDFSKSFEAKFSVITPNIQKQSDYNLDRLKTSFREKRPNFQRYLDQAKSSMLSVDKNLVVTHGMSANSAIKSINSGRFASVDELRRAGVPVKSGQASDLIDGVIGEQDVIFAAIEPVQDSGVALSNFGPVTFLFNKEKALEKGYFTPFAFGQGSPRMGLANNVNTLPEYANLLRESVPLYKSSIFSGKTAYETFMLISKAQLLWERDQDFSKETKAIAEVQQKFQNDPQSVTPEELNKSMRPELVQDIFRKIGQDYPSHLPLNINSVARIGMYLNKENIRQRSYNTLPATLNETLKILDAYQGFPVSVNKDPLLYTEFAYFWELKIPREVSLEIVDKIVVRVAQSDEYMFSVIEAIGKYSATSGRKFIQTLDSKGNQIFTFQ